MEKIVMLTAYDYPFARILDDAGVDIVLVGDSLGNVVLGYKDTRPVTMEDMVHHTKAVARGIRRALLVADIPYRSASVKNAKRLIKAGAKAVKIEGVKAISVIKSIIKAGIPVMGHLGYLPQTMRKPKIQRSVDMIEEAKKLEAAGVFAIVLEMVEKELAKKIARAVSVPVIGCGSGPFCDGQVLVSYDLLGLGEWAPSFARQKVNLRSLSVKAVKDYIKEVKK